MVALCPGVSKYGTLGSFSLLEPQHDFRSMAAASPKEGLSPAVQEDGDESDGGGSFGDWDEPVDTAVTGFFGEAQPNAEAAFAEFESRTGWDALGWLKEQGADMYMYIKLVNWIRRQEDVAAFKWSALTPADLEFDGLFTPTLPDDGMLEAWHLVEAEGGGDSSDEDADAAVGPNVVPPRHAQPAIVPGQFDDAEE